MPLPSIGSVISLSNMLVEFGGGMPTSLSNFFRGGPNVSSNITDVPASGTIGMAHFFEKSAVPLQTLYYLDSMGLASNPMNAYSTRKVISSYTGPMLRVRNGTNNQEAAVYFDAAGAITQIETFNNSADNTVRSTVTGASSLSNWLAGGIAYTALWFDQMGRSNVYSSTTTQQPKYDYGSNVVEFVSASNHTMFYPAGWGITDMTFLFDIIPTTVTASTGAAWFSQQNIVWGERGGSTTDWGIPMATPAKFGFASGPSDSASTLIDTNGINTRSVMCITRTGATGGGSLYRDGSNITAFTRDTGTLTGQNPTQLGRGGTDFLGAKYRSIIYHNTRLVDASVKLMSDYSLNGTLTARLTSFTVSQPTSTTATFTYAGTYSYVVIRVVTAGGTVFNTSGNVTDTTYSISELSSRTKYVVTATPYIGNNVGIPTSRPFVTPDASIAAPGVIDSLSTAAQATCVALFGLKLLRAAYTGAVVRVRRSTDNVQQDFYANSDGTIAIDVNGTGTTLTTWLGGATAFVVTWYDQSGRAKHLNQATTGSQPSVVFDSALARWCVYLQSTRTLTGPNVFDTTAVSNMHLTFTSKEISRVENFLVSLNGMETNARFTFHAPWSDGVWYSDFGDFTTNRASSPGNIVPVGQRAIYSGYKSSSDVRNGFRLNKGTRYLSPSSSSASVSNGIVLSMTTSSANHYMYAIAVFNTKLPTSDEILLEDGI